MILCPTNPAAAKITNQFLRILFLAKDKILDGSSIDDLSYPTLPVAECQCNFDYLSDVEDNHKKRIHNWCFICFSSFLCQENLKDHFIQLHSENEADLDLVVGKAP